MAGVFMPHTLEATLGLCSIETQVQNAGHTRRKSLTAMTPLPSIFTASNQMFCNTSYTVLRNRPGPWLMEQAEQAGADLSRRSRRRAGS